MSISAKLRNAAGNGTETSVEFVELGDSYIGQSGSFYLNTPPSAQVGDLMLVLGGSTYLAYWRVNDTPNWTFENIGQFGRSLCGWKIVEQSDIGEDHLFADGYGYGYGRNAQMMLWRNAAISLPVTKETSQYSIDLPLLTSPAPASAFIESYGYTQPTTTGQQPVPAGATQLYQDTGFGNFWTTSYINYTGDYDPPFFDGGDDHHGLGICLYNPDDVPPPPPNSSQNYNFAAYKNGARLGGDNGTNTSDAYFGPNGYNYNAHSGTYTAVGAIWSDTLADANSTGRSNKHNASASTFTGGGSAAAPFQMVIDLGEVCVFNKSYYYQTFADGKTTHARLKKSDTLRTRTDSGWELVHDWVTLLNNTSGDSANAAFSNTSARYIMVEMYNNGTLGDPSYTELYNIKLFNE
jgi:hypothetical protein